MEQHLYVNIPGKSPLFSTITEALESVPYGAPEEKTFPAEKENISPVIIHIGNGIYRQKLVVSRPNVTFMGESRDKTVIVYGDKAIEVMPDGTNRGTFRTASVRIDTHDFTALHLTFQNDAGLGRDAGQALALYVDGDRNYFEDCRLLGNQDTLFTAPLPEKEMQAGGFRGPGEYKPRILGRHLYRNCYISGNVDFIFGSGIAYFENCTIFSCLSGEVEKSTHGYVTAASTPKDQPFGYVFHDCHLVSDCPPHTVYLGRPWREWAKTVFIHCELGEHIHPLGWVDWKKEHGHFYYGEYDSYGPGAAPTERADFSHQLTAEEAAKYTMENVLQGWIPEI